MMPYYTVLTALDGLDDDDDDDEGDSATDEIMEFLVQRNLQLLMLEAQVCLYV